MRSQVVWAASIWEILEELPVREGAQIVDRLDLLRHFPYMYPVRVRGRFRRHRFFQAGNWLVFYKVVENTVYIRGLWPARIP